VQSRLPDPEWLEAWLDTQIRFDTGWEKKVVDRILHNVSLLFDQTFATVQELNRYRKEVVNRLADAGAAAPAHRVRPAKGAERNGQTPCRPPKG
jgi:hypothetical protein